MNATLMMAGHALLAGIFFFCLQRFVLGQSLESSLIWGLAGAAGAATLAWMQQRRGG